MNVHSSAIAFDPGSFRDPSGRVFTFGDRILRGVAAGKVADARSFLDSGFFAARTGKTIVATRTLADSEATAILGSNRGAFNLVLEHDRIETISYPFEWPFSLLKRAAKLHLQIHLDALEEGFDLSDSSAYNIQFVGPEPIFIDTLSFRAYEQGAYWHGYKQFCEQFLCPLLLSSAHGVAYNDWYRGSLNGIDIQAVAKLLPFRSRLSLQTLMHIFFHARLIERIHSHDNRGPADTAGKKLPLASLRGMLTGMLSLVRSLQPKGLKNTYWREYEARNSYSSDDASRKRQIVSDFISARRPNLVLDVGCNSGDFSELCLANGATSAVGVDFDLGALEAAVTRAVEKNLRLLPLYLDLTNPSPEQGWASAERSSFSSRVKPDAMVALAVIHHLVIGKNILMPEAVRWLVGRAPSGLIEFVPKTDPMVQGLLRGREYLFPDYAEEAFRASLSSIARITSEAQSSATGRKIFTYECQV